MLHNRFVIPVVVLFALEHGVPTLCSKRVRRRYAAAVPTPGQPTAPAGAGAVPACGATAGSLSDPNTGGSSAQKPEDKRASSLIHRHSLVIYGTAQEFQNLKNILKEFGHCASAVLFGVLIAEVTLQNTEIVWIGTKFSVNI